MFQSISFIFLKSENDLNHYLYVITDTDFTEEVVETVPENQGLGSSIVAAIINCYSSKNLNVAYNLILFMQFWENANSVPRAPRRSTNRFSILNQISRYKQLVLEFDKYLPKIEKYLVLI